MKSFESEFKEQLTDAEPYARRIQIALARGNHDAARFAIEEHRRFMVEKQKPPGNPLKLTLYEVGISMRTIGYLETQGLDTIEDLLDLTWEEVQKIPGVGPAAEKEILEVLQKLGFELKAREA